MRRRTLVLAGGAERGHDLADRVVELGHVAKHRHLARREAFACVHLAELGVAGVGPVDVLERKVQEERLRGLFHAPEELHGRATAPTIRRQSDRQNDPNRRQDTS